MGRLVGQLVLVPDRAPTEAVALRVLLSETRSANGNSHTWCKLEIQNQLTRETATSLLHFLHHLSSGTFINELSTTLWKYEYAQPSDLCPQDIDSVETGTHLNQAIFDAMQQVSGRRVLKLYALELRGNQRQSVLWKPSNVRLHHKG